MAKSVNKEKKIGYNEAVAEIESIIRRLENQTMDVDLLASEVARATELITLCKEKLAVTEKAVADLFEKEK